MVSSELSQVQKTPEISGLQRALAHGLLVAGQESPDMKLPGYTKWVLLAAVGLAGALMFACIGERDLPPSHGIRNFDKVNDHLYRGAQPDAAGLKNLSDLGIKTIVNLRMPKEGWAQEEAEARAVGIVCTNVPLKGLGRPADEQIARILSIIESSPGPVFVHCEHGCDRTGTVIASYRIRHDLWTADKAQQEANVHGMSGLERGMKEFIADFGKAATTKPAVNQ